MTRTKPLKIVIYYHYNGKLHCVCRLPPIWVLLVFPLCTQGVANGTTMVGWFGVAKEGTMVSCFGQLQESHSCHGQRVKNPLSILWIKEWQPFVLFWHIGLPYIMSRGFFLIIGPSIIDIGHVDNLSMEFWPIVYWNNSFKHLFI